MLLTLSLFSHQVGNHSEILGYEGPSRLPVFTEEEIEFNKGTADFFGLNHYTSNLILNNDNPPTDLNFDADKVSNKQKLNKTNSLKNSNITYFYYTKELKTVYS